MDNLDPQFNIDAIPLDAYIELWRNMPDDMNQANLIDLNTGWYYDFDDTIYDNRLEAIARFAPYFAHHYSKWHRRLAQLAAQIPSVNRNAFFNLYVAASAEHAPAWAKGFMAHLNSMHKLEPQYRDANDFGLEPGVEPVPDYQRFTSPNIGSWGQTQIQQSREKAEMILRLAWPVLHSYYEETGIRFELRHPIAMSNPAVVDQFSAHRIPMRDLPFLLGSAHTSVYDVISRIEPAIWPAEENYRGTFDRWHGLTATAVFSENGNYASALIPRHLPPWLLSPSHNVLPVYTRKHLTPTIEDEWADVGFLTQVSILDGSLPNQKTIHDSILDLGWLVAAAATLLAMNVKTGSGQHRITWLHSTMNAAHVSEIMFLAPMILKRVAETRLPCS